MSNLTTLCAAHHHHGVHALVITVEGEAPHGLTWKLGLRPDGSALLVVGPGERIIQPAAAGIP